MALVKPEHENSANNIAGRHKLNEHELDALFEALREEHRILSDSINNPEPPSSAASEIFEAAPLQPKIVLPTSEPVALDLRVLNGVVVPEVYHEGPNGLLIPVQITAVGMRMSGEYAAFTPDRNLGVMIHLALKIYNRFRGIDLDAERTYRILMAEYADDIPGLVDMPPWKALIKIIRLFLPQLFLYVAYHALALAVFGWAIQTEKARVLLDSIRTGDLSDSFRKFDRKMQVSLHALYEI